MSWFDTSGLTSLAKTALKEAQKTIDKALDIQDESSDDAADEPSKDEAASATSTQQKDDFFSSWGLTTSAEITQNEPKEQPVVTESPTKSTQQSLWGSFTGNFFEPPKAEATAAIVSPPRASSLNVISDAKYGTCDELFNKSQLSTSDTTDNVDASKVGNEECADRRDSSKSQHLSLVSSSDSVEVLSHSTKTTPDSDVMSVATTPHSSSLKLNSESVEVLPDSLASPSSIECLGMDSRSSSTPSINLTEEGDSEKQSSAMEETTEKPSGDSVSLVADDDEDTMSYNSISECTAPTVLDIDEKSPKKVRLDKKMLEPIHMEVVQCKSDTSDGSWSDRTLQADTGDNETDKEDIVVDKLSDSSSFYNVTIKDKERTSPTSSDKSDMVKVGSEQTSGHTSGDDIETTTSSDIEIIPSPNGERKHKTESHLVDIVLGKSLASKIRGHNRELSETSIHSNVSEESQTEIDSLIRRLSEMTEVLEARETRLMEVSRRNAQLMESNEELKSQVQCLQNKHQGSDSLTEEYTQRMSALEKKFQQAIREKDQLRKQLDICKSESCDMMESRVRERDDMIAQLQQEGEKLSLQHLQHSNIIKKLRAKDKDNEHLIKTLRDKVSELTSELDRLKRAMAAKEELEVTQIEAVYKLTNANKRMETELVEVRSVLEDTEQRLSSCRASLEAAKHEVTDMQSRSANGAHAQRQLSKATAEREQALNEAAMLAEQLNMLREERKVEEARWVSRVETLRGELKWAREANASASTNGGGGGGAANGVSALLMQLASLQESALKREHTHNNHTRALQQQIEELEMKLAKCAESERVSREECTTLLHRLQTAEHTIDALNAQMQQINDAAQHNIATQHSKSHELELTVRDQQSRMTELNAQLHECQMQLQQERDTLDTEKKRNCILQEQLSIRGDISPSHSLASDNMSVSLWPQQELSEVGECGSVLSSVDQLAATVSRREAELRTITDMCSKLRTDRTVLQDLVATLQDKLDQFQNLQEQYDALLQMYGEKEEQLAEVRLDLHDVTQLYKQQLDEFIHLKRLQKQ